MSTWMSKQQAVERIAELMDRVQAGEEFVLTDNDKPVLRLVQADPEEAATERDIADSLADIDAGRVRNGRDVLADLAADYERAFGQRPSGI